MGGKLEGGLTGLSAWTETGRFPDTLWKIL